MASLSTPVRLIVAPGFPDTKSQMTNALATMRIANDTVWADSLDALEVLLAEPDPAVLFVSEQGPSFDGREFLERWSEHPAKERVRVVALAPSKATASDLVRTGADSSLELPVTAAALWESIVRRARFGVVLIESGGDS